MTKLVSIGVSARATTCVRRSAYSMSTPISEPGSAAAATTTPELCESEITGDPPTPDSATQRAYGAPSAPRWISTSLGSRCWPRSAAHARTTSLRANRPSSHSCCRLEPGASDCQTSFSAAVKAAPCAGLIVMPLPGAISSISIRRIKTSAGPIAQSWLTNCPNCTGHHRSRAECNST